MFKKAERGLASSSAILWADVVLEVVVAVAAFALAHIADRWLAIDSFWLHVAGAAFLAAAAAIVPIARTPRSNVVQIVAAANVLGGLLGWLLLAVVWSRFEPEGRWVMAAVFDAFILIGIAEWLAVRRGQFE
jgi:hypothetical protein